MKRLVILALCMFALPSFAETHSTDGWYETPHQEDLDVLETWILANCGENMDVDTTQCAQTRTIIYGDWYGYASMANPSGGEVYEADGTTTLGHANWWTDARMYSGPDWLSLDRSRLEGHRDICRILYENFNPACALTHAALWLHYDANVDSQYPYDADVLIELGRKGNACGPGADRVCALSRVYMWKLMRAVGRFGFWGG